MDKREGYNDGNICGFFLGMLMYCFGGFLGVTLLSYCHGDLSKKWKTVFPDHFTHLSYKCYYVSYSPKNLIYARARARVCVCVCVFCAG
jgi:hypothetical protein